MDEERCSAKDDQTGRHCGSSSVSSSSGPIRDDFGQLRETAPSAHDNRRASHHCADRAIAATSAAAQPQQSKESSTKNHSATKPRARSSNGQDPRVATKKADPRRSPPGSSRYEQDMESKRRDIQSEKGKLLSEPANYAVSLALGEVEELDNYEARLCAKSAQLSPLRHAAGCLAGKTKQGDDEQQSHGENNPRNGGSKDDTRRREHGDNSNASMDEGITVGVMAGQNANCNGGDKTRVGCDREVSSYEAATDAGFGYVGMGAEDGASASENTSDGIGATEEEDHRVSIIAHGRITEPGTEHGEAQINGGTEFDGENLAVAVAVSANHGEGFIQAAIEYDPDAKPPLYKNRRFRFYFVAASFLLVTIGVSVGLGMTSTQDDSTLSPTSAPTTERDASGILEQLVATVGAGFFRDKSSPQAKAADWLINRDELELAPGAINLIQRYMLAVFYYSTTEEKEWKSCNAAKAGESEFCNFTWMDETYPAFVFINVPWIRWLSGTHECEWAGVYCDTMNLTRGLYLNGQEISSTLPTELALVPYLEDLDLHWNSFHGTLPTEFGGMHSFGFMSVHYNEFTGTVPEEWYNMNDLHLLNIGGNYLTGTISTRIGELTALRGLFVHENSITGTIPTELGNLEFMANMRFGPNKMSGTVPSEIGRLQRLRRMRLYRNSLTGPLPSEMGNMRAMADMRLEFNQFSGSVPSELYGMPLLKRWELHHCNMTGTISALIGRMQHLEVLHIHENSFHGTIPSELGQLRQLDSLRLHKNNFTGSVADGICALRRRPSGITVFDADCGATNDVGPAQVECSCCTGCCDSATGSCFIDTTR